MATTVGTLLFRIEADTKALRRGMDQTKSAIGKLQSTVKTFGAAIIAAFSVRAVVNFGKEAVKLGGQMEGVREAFNKLNKPDLLNNLRRATRGTVTDLQLMQYAVRAENFKIPLSKLATFFEFATKRATQTGESVDYLVNSIITGIGRKSSLVMDNLGISATEMQAEFKKMGDFGLAAGNIIERELTKMGDVAETTNQKLEAMNVSWTNMKTTIGEAIAPAIGNFADGVTKALDQINQADMSGLEKLLYLLWGVGKGKFLRPEDILPKSAYGFGLKKPPGYEKETKKPIAKPLSKIATIGTPAEITGTQTLFEEIFGLPGSFERKYIELFERVNTLTRAFTEENKKIIIDFSETVKAGFMSIADSIAYSLEQVFTGDFGIEQVFQELLKSIGRFIQQLGKLYIAYGIGQMAWIKALKNITNPASAAILIAAGAGMVAIGAAITGLASRTVGGGGGGGSFSLAGAYPSSGAGSLTHNIKGSTKIQGQDMLVIYERATGYHSQVT